MSVSFQNLNLGVAVFVATLFFNLWVCSSREPKEITLQNVVFKWWEGLDFDQKTMFLFRHDLECNLHTSTHLSFTINEFWTQINIFFKNIAKIGKVTEVEMIVTTPFPLVYFTFTVVQVAIIRIMKVPQKLKKMFFSLNFSLPFSSTSVDDITI